MIPLQKLQQAAWAAFHILRGDPLSNAREAVQDAVREHARRLAECHYHQNLMLSFADEAAGIDPHTDWRLFANVKDSWKASSDDLTVESNRLHTAELKLAACRQRLSELKAAE